MKKRLLIAALAATMSVAVSADISITGDAYVSFASQEALGTASATNNDNKDDQRVRVKVVGSAGDTKVVAVIRNGSATRVDESPIATDSAGTDGNRSLHMDSLYITTKVGPVDIKAGDYWGTIGLGAHSMEAAKKNAVSISTKVGDNWKAGIFTANGSSDKGSDSTNVNVSGKIGPVEVTAVHNPDDFTDISAQATIGNIFVAAELWDDKAETDNDTTLVHIGGKVGGFKWDIAQIKNDVGAFTTNSYTIPVEEVLYQPGTLQFVLGADGGGSATTTVIADNNGKYVAANLNMMIAGSIVAVNYTPEELGAMETLVDSDDNTLIDNYKPVYVSGNPEVLGVPAHDDTHTYLVPRGLGVEIDDVSTLDVDAAGNLIDENGDILIQNVSDAYTHEVKDSHSTGKLAPLGSMLIGKGARGRTTTAVANVTDFTEILGVSVSTEIAGNTVKAIYTKNTIGDADDITGTELIVSRPLSNGTTLTANIGKISGIDNVTKNYYGGITGNATNTGIRLDVSF